MRVVALVGRHAPLVGAPLVGAPLVGERGRGGEQRLRDDCDGCDAALLLLAQPDPDAVPVGEAGHHVQTEPESVAALLALLALLAFLTLLALLALLPMPAMLVVRLFRVEVA